MTTKKWLLIVSSLFLLSSCNDSKTTTVEKEATSRVNQLPYYNDAFFTPHWFETANDSLKDFHKIPDYSFTNQLGATIDQNTFKDKIYITDFFFTTCPGICPQMTLSMTELQAEFADDADILLLSHSVTPDFDTPEILNNYADRNNVHPEKWHLVTGDKDQIYNLGRNYYFVEEDLGIKKDKDDFLHTENFVLIDKNKHIRGIYNGLNKSSVKQLIADVRTLQKEG